MNTRYNWLRGEIEIWVREGLVTRATADALLARYSKLPGSGRSSLRVGLAALGALLVGGGIILLLAHNWADLSRPTRTAIALAPLVIAQGLALFWVWRGRDETAWREGVGIFWTLSVGAAIAMVSQIYHLSGSYDSFMLTWMLLSLPVAFVLCSALAATIYLAGVVSWAAPIAGEPPRVLALWPLVAAVAPLLSHASRRGLFTPGLALLRWSWVAALALAPGITLSRQIPGLWIPIYGSLFSLFWLIDEVALRRAPSRAHRPMRVGGSLGAVVMALVLSYDEPWREIARADALTLELDDTYWMFDVAMLTIFAGAAAILLAAAWRRLRWPDCFVAAGFLAFLGGYALTAHLGPHPAVPWTFSVFAFTHGIALAADGVRREALGRINTGLALMAIVVGLRFFDSSLPLITRGLVFVALGVCFFVANVLFARKFRSLV
jgi:hypothetical protein